MESNDPMEQSIDVQSILREIQLEIKANGYTNDMLGFDDTFDQQRLVGIATRHGADDVERDLESLYYAWNVHLYRPLCGNRMTVFIKKIIRRALNFYISPTVNDQNAFNLSVARILEKNSRMEAQILALCDRVAELESSARERSRHG
jgi:hypothetical protein